MDKNEIFKVLLSLESEDKMVNVINEINKLIIEDGKKVNKCSGCTHCTCGKNKTEETTPTEKAPTLQEVYTKHSDKWTKDLDKALIVYKKSCVQIVRDILHFIENEMGENVLIMIKDRLRLEYSNISNESIIYYIDNYGFRYNIEEMIDEDVLEVIYSLTQEIRQIIENNTKINFRM